MTPTELTRTHTAFDGQVTFRMMSYRTLGVDIVIEQLAHGADLSGVQASFALCDTLTTDVTFELAEDARVDLRAFEMYWRDRPTDALARWQSFVALLSADVINEWWVAYEATRATEGRVPGEV